MNRILVEAIANLAMFLEFADESVLTLEDAVRQQEQLAFSLQKLSPADREEFISALAEFSRTVSASAEREYLDRLPSEMGIQDDSGE